MDQDLTAALVARVQAGPTEVVEELKARLALKEKLFQELLSDRSRQSSEHQAQVQDLFNTLSSKDQYLQVGPRLLFLFSPPTGFQCNVKASIRCPRHLCCDWLACSTFPLRTIPTECP